MVNGLGQNHLKWLQVRKFYKDHVYFVDLWITLNFIHSWGGLEFQLKVCVEERKEKIWWYARKKWGFFIMTAFSPTFPEKKSKYNIYFPKSFRQWKKNYFPGCGKLFASMDITAVRRANLFLAKSESKGTELSGVVNLLEVDIYGCYGVFYCDVTLSITDCC